MYQTVRGMRDFMPEDMRKRQYVFDTVRKVFEGYGFEPLDTPAVESFALLSAKGGGGEEIRKEIYCFKDQGDRELGLRFDPTVPTARVIASSPSLAKPFKRYFIGPVWRYDRPQSGRYREFWQGDVDIFGVKSQMADAECIAVFCKCLEKLGFKDYSIKVNNRKLLEAICLECGVPEAKAADAFRCIDKLQKFGEGAVKEEMGKAGITCAEKLLKRITAKAGLDKLPPGEGTEKIKELFSYFGQMGISDKVVLDLSLARGLDYYTGSVFEAVVEGGKWSIAGGGRYDNLIETLGGKPTPATGFSLGVERVIQLMDERKLFPGLQPKTVFVAPVNDEMREKALEITQQLRTAGIPAETDMMKRNLRKQFDYCNAKGIPYCIVVGPKELEKKEVVLRDMKTGKEKKVRLTGLAAAFSS